ncbi:hypothetical protein K488DRAFT_73549 [Vararia minispora EC-137]|uniref:Uncharacterized protein n=1 Tax=Vararia minispora EC-137 TaxID=1314806 RepID=A0ACB8QAZ5_9AGAM|nr:hypothetical protein K488DRAFT_73549 [Vararia minispora EC-137]
MQLSFVDGSEVLMNLVLWIVLTVSLVRCHIAAGHGAPQGDSQACGINKPRSPFEDSDILFNPGDAAMGVVTQCIKSSKCFRAKRNVIHPGGPPALGSECRSSLTALVANVDSDSAGPIATMQIQTFREEIIQDLESMLEYVLRMYMGYPGGVDKKDPKSQRINFYPAQSSFFTSKQRGIDPNTMSVVGVATDDGLQSLSFAFCHVYAHSIRSVSIPALVYYTDIVCPCAKHHYDPSTNLELTGSESVTNTEHMNAHLEVFLANFRPLHESIRKMMYLC